MNREKHENEKLLAAAVRYLLQGDNKEAALLLMRGEIERYYYEEHEDAWFVELRGTRQLCDAIEFDYEDPVGQDVYHAIKVVLTRFGGG